MIGIEEELLPNDLHEIPPPGSEQQRQMVALMEEVCDENYEDNLSDILEVDYREVLGDSVRWLDSAMSLNGNKGQAYLDLGTGMGLTAEFVVRALNRGFSNITLHDISEVLLDRAKTRIQNTSPNATVTTAKLDLLNGNLLHALPKSSIDVVTASNFFEHIPIERQAEIFQQVHEILRPGGVFLNIAHVKVLAQEWKQNILSSLRHRWMGKGNSEREFNRLVADHFLKEHVHTSVPRLLSQLNEAGFGFSDVVYRRWIFAAVVSIKQG